MWQTIEGKLTKEFSFQNFTEALAFVNKVGKLAEGLNHHPDILMHSYKKVRIMLFTHSENKISDKDYELAEMIDDML
jgi:4a-hydroxytetrahydrobiopterin dehydratase